MRAVKMLFTGSIAVAVVAVACGGSSQVTPSDAGAPDGTALGDSAADAPVDLDASDAAICTIDADLEKAAPPDAALDEAGASVGTCIGCARAHCGSEISTCNADCTCNNTFNCLFSCLGGIGGTLLLCYTTVCNGSLSLNSGGPDTSLVLCAAQSCAAQCAACSLYKGLCPSDAATPLDSAGVDSATDAPSEATADAPVDATGDATGE